MEVIGDRSVARHKETLSAPAFVIAILSPSKAAWKAPFNPLPVNSASTVPVSAPTPRTTNTLSGTPGLSNARAGYPQVRSVKERMLDRATQHGCLKDGPRIEIYTLEGCIACVRHPQIGSVTPLFVTLGASADQGIDAHTTIEGFWFGLSKRSFQFA